jgi:DNA replication and repair protein RecF
VALTLRLSEASYLSSVKGEEPIILLDDVLSEMDLQRRTRVLEKITAYEQAVITTTDQDIIELHLGTGPDYFQVLDGSVNNVG